MSVALALSTAAIGLGDLRTIARSFAVCAAQDDTFSSAERS